MTFTICKHRKYQGGDVLESSVKVETLNIVLDLVKREVLNGETFEAIKRGEIGHHFADDAEFVYQIVVK